MRGARVRAQRYYVESFLLFYLSSGGLVKIWLKLTTPPRFRVVPTPFQANYRMNSRRPTHPPTPLLLVCFLVS